jgi:hypothetical protein
MIKLLGYLAQDTKAGDLNAALQLVDAFQKKQQTGLIEILWGESQQVVFVFSDGQLVGASLLEPTTAKKISIERLPSLWVSNKTSLRVVHTCHEAVRCVLAIMEWYPPNRTFSIEPGEIQKYLNLSQSHQHNGLYHLVWGNKEGYIFLVDGLPVLDDSILYTKKECAIGKDSLEQLLACSDAGGTLEFYEASVSGTAYQQISFRFAFTQLLQGMLNRYERLVGAEMVRSLTENTNQHVDDRNYHLKIVQKRLADTLVSTSMGPIFQAYRFLFKSLLDQMSDLIGNSLAHSIAFEVFRSMPLEKQNILRDSPLMVMIISSR